MGRRDSARTREKLRALAAGELSATQLKALDAGVERLLRINAAGG